MLSLSSLLLKMLELLKFRHAFDLILDSDGRHLSLVPCRILNESGVSVKEAVDFRKLIH